MEIRTLLIDDEDLARQDMRHLLATYPDIHIIDEAADATEALTKIRRHKPDLIFLDINMPGKNGFDLLAELEETPRVIFVTAYDEFALRAFETNALDYLLKPVRPERLEKTISGVRETMRTQMQLPASEAPPNQAYRLQPDSLVFIKDGEKCYFLKLSNIFLFESDDNYVRVFFGSEKPLYRKSLNMLTEKSLIFPPNLVGPGIKIVL